MHIFFTHNRKFKFLVRDFSIRSHTRIKYIVYIFSYPPPGKLCVKTSQVRGEGRQKSIHNKRVTCGKLSGVRGQPKLSGHNIPGSRCMKRVFFGGSNAGLQMKGQLEPMFTRLSSELIF